MRLAGHSLHAYALPYARPVVWSDIVEDAAPFVLLRLTADSGEQGVAEVTVKPTWGGVTARSLIATIEDIFIPLLRTLDLSDPQAVRRGLDRIPENLSAKCLVDNACWDLKAAQAQRPLWQTWNGSRRVELSWAVTRQAPQAMADEAVNMCAHHGFRTLKVKGGQGVAIDIEGIRAIARAVGDGVALYVDCNGAYRLDEAADYARAVADAGAVVIEDPCQLVPDAAFAALRAQSPIPVLVDFGSWSLRDAKLFLAQGAQGLSAKPGRFGLSDCRLMQDAARQAGCGVVAGLMGESALGTLAALQFAAVVPAPMLPAELTWYLAMTEQVSTYVPAIVDGCVDLPDTPSLASLVDWSAVKRFAL
jgi:L-alanine-DL-glutamate epimerase-like enolase superfamily enzyme